MKKKILFWLLAVVSILAGLFVSVFSWASEGLGFYYGIISHIFCYIGMLAAVVSIVCVVLGSRKLRKGETKKAILLALAGLIYAGAVIGELFIEEAVDTVRMEKDIAARNEQMYGAGWDSAPAIDGIPGRYQEVLGKFYAVVRDEWSGDQLMDLGGTIMPAYYGDSSLDNIGFILKDLNGDGSDELLIAATAPTEAGGTAFFCMYSDPENPYLNLDGIEDETFYLHEVDGVYMAEIEGRGAAWQFDDEDGDKLVEITYLELALDPANRLTLDLIPFSRYR